MISQDLTLVNYDSFHFSVGGKDQGTRFLSFVDAIKGFRHLLVQEDLDRALSLCTGMRGQLKNKFIVLSDDRILPPYQGGKGKRAHPGDDEVNPASVKRQHHNPPPSTSSYVQVVQGMTPHVQLVPGVAMNQLFVYTSWTLSQAKRAAALPGASIPTKCTNIPTSIKSSKAPSIPNSLCIDSGQPWLLFKGQLLV